MRSFLLLILVGFTLANPQFMYLDDLSDLDYNNAILKHNFEEFKQYPINISNKIMSAVLFMNNTLTMYDKYIENLILEYEFVKDKYLYSINFLIKCFEYIYKNNNIIQNKCKNNKISITKNEYIIYNYLYNYYGLEFIKIDQYKTLNLLETIITPLNEENKINYIKNIVLDKNYLDKIFKNLTLDKNIYYKNILLLLNLNHITGKNLLIFIKNNFDKNTYLLFENFVTKKNKIIQKKFKLDTINNTKTIMNITFDFQNYIITKKLKIRDYFIVDKKLSKLLNEPVSKMLKINDINFI